jgi:hypothetical protein
MTTQVMHLDMDEMRSSEEGPVCPACTAVIVAGAGSTGAILAVCIGKFRQFFVGEPPWSISENKGEVRWQRAKRETRKSGRGISR